MAQVLHPSALRVPAKLFLPESKMDMRLRSRTLQGSTEIFQCQKNKRRRNKSCSQGPQNHRKALSSCSSRYKIQQKPNKTKAVSNKNGRRCSAGWLITSRNVTRNMSPATFVMTASLALCAAVFGLHQVTNLHPSSMSHLARVKLHTQFHYNPVIISLL